MQRRQESIVAPLHFGPPVLILPDILHSLLIVRVQYQVLDVGDIQVERFHGVEDILRHGGLLANLLVQVESVSPGQQNREPEDGHDFAILPLLPCLYFLVG